MGTINLAAGVQWCRQGTVRWMEGREGPRLFKGHSDEERRGGRALGKAQLQSTDTRGHISSFPAAHTDGYSKCGAEDAFNETSASWGESIWCAQTGGLPVTAEQMT